MGGLTETQFTELSQNQLSQDEWPQLKKTLQAWFQKHKSKDLDRVLSSKDCCV